MLIRRTSGSPELDQAALEILKLASPFDPFPPELAAKYRVLRFAYEWQFSGGAPGAGERIGSLRLAAGMPILRGMGGKYDSPASGEDPPGDEEAGDDPPFAEGGPGSLTNHLLIAMPQLSDPNFAQTVALICEHTDKGALGIVLNKPLPMKLSDVLSQMKLEPTSRGHRRAARAAWRSGAHRPRLRAAPARGASGTTPTRSPTPSR